MASPQFVAFASRIASSAPVVLSGDLKEDLEDELFRKGASSLQLSSWSAEEQKLMAAVAAQRRVEPTITQSGVVQQDLARTGSNGGAAAPAENAQPVQVKVKDGEHHGPGSEQSREIAESGEAAKKEAGTRDLERTIGSCTSTHSTRAAPTTSTPTSMGSICASISQGSSEMNDARELLTPEGPLAEHPTLKIATEEQPEEPPMMAVQQMAMDGRTLGLLELRSYLAYQCLHVHTRTENDKNQQVQRCWFRAAAIVDALFSQTAAASELSLGTRAGLSLACMAAAEIVLKMEDATR
ncbi:unnamed protein product, partial [Polarella glacialis]